VPQARLSQSPFDCVVGLFSLFLFQIAPSSEVHGHCWPESSGQDKMHCRVYVSLIYPLYLEYAGTDSFKNAYDEDTWGKEHDKEKLQKSKEHSGHPFGDPPYPGVDAWLIQTFKETDE